MCQPCVLPWKTPRLALVFWQKMKTSILQLALGNKSPGPVEYKNVVWVEKIVAGKWGGWDGRSHVLRVGSWPELEQLWWQQQQHCASWSFLEFLSEQKKKSTPFGFFLDQLVKKSYRDQMLTFSNCPFWLWTWRIVFCQQNVHVVLDPTQTQGGGIASLIREVSMHPARTPLRSHFTSGPKKLQKNVGTQNLNV